MDRRSTRHRDGETAAVRRGTRRQAPPARRAVPLLTALIAVGALAFAGGSATAAVPTPGPGEMVVTVRVGGDRTGANSVGPLAGVRLGLYATAGAREPLGNGWGICTSDADGDCSFVVPGDEEGSEPWVRQISAPAGWFVNPSLRTGPASGSGSIDAPYQFQTPVLALGRTYSSTADFMFSTNLSDTNASGGVWQQSRVNPALSGTCGLDVAIVMDLSRSVGRNLPALKAAADGFVDALAGTPSRVALFSFSATSPSAGSTGNVTALQPVSTQAGADAVKAIYAPWDLASGTNWDQGLFQVAQASERYELVVVLTDGNPSRWGDPIQGNGSSTHFADVENGIFSANAIKAKGSRVVALGVGTGAAGLTALNLAAISGQTAWNGSNTIDADYFQTTDYAQAGAELRALALSQCANSLTVVKQTVPAETQGEDVTGARPAGPGWTFDGSTTAPFVGGLPDTLTTSDDGTGAVVYDLQVGPDTPAVLPTTVTERQQTGWTIVTQGGRQAVCTNLADDSPLPVTDAGAGSDRPGFTVDVPRSAAVSCTVYNRAVVPVVPPPTGGGGGEVGGGSGGGGGGGGGGGTGDGRRATRRPTARRRAAGVVRLGLRKLASHRAVRPGQAVRFTLVVRNSGSRAARGLLLCDRLPARVTVVSRGGGRLASGRLCWRVGALGAGRSARRSLVVRVARNAPAGPLVNRATARAGGRRATARRAVRVAGGQIAPSVGFTG